MNKLSILYFFASIFVISLGILVYVKNPRQIVNRVFSFLCLTAFIWQFFYGLMLNSTGIMALYMAKIGHFAVPYIPVVYLHFVISLLGLKRLRFVYVILYLAAITSSVLTISSGLCFDHLKLHTWGLYPEGNILMLIDFAICGATASFAIFLLVKGYYKTRKQAKGSLHSYKLKYHLIALIIFAIGIIDYLPKFYKYPVDIIPIGNIALIIFVSITSYAILKHHLLDINIVIRKGLVYSILVTFITLLYFVIVLFAENTFRGFIGYRSVPLTLGMVAVFIFLLHPLQNKIQKFVDNFFFKKTRDTLEKENERLKEEIRRTDRLRAVATLAAGMAHEIKNPLTSIKTFTEYLDVKFDDKDFRDKFKRIVGSEVDRINTIVGNLLDFAKPRPLSERRVNVNKLLEETLTLLSNDFIRRKIDVIRGYSPEATATIKADPNRLKQAFLNLFLNAMDAMKTGGKLVVEMGKTKNGSLQIIIEDTGKGISEETLSHIFDPFYSNKETGTGLGLSIVHGIIKEHGGQITCESAIEKGTRFIITLPS